MKIDRLFSQLGDVPIESKVVTKSISSAQKRVEGVNFDVRKPLLEYDDVLRQQREIIYEQRNFTLENDDVHGIVRGMFDRVVSNPVAAKLDNRNEDKVNAESCWEGLSKMGIHANLTIDQPEGKGIQQIRQMCCQSTRYVYEKEIAAITTMCCRWRRRRCSR